MAEDIDEEEELVWEEPGQVATRSKWHLTLEKLHQHPGKWARVKTFEKKRNAYSTGHQVIARHGKNFDGGEFKHKANDGKLYMRFVPEGWTDEVAEDDASVPEQSRVAS